jgi:hypothetical protein
LFWLFCCAKLRFFLVIFYLLWVIFLWSLASGSEALREAHVGAKRAKHRAKRSPECADPNVVRGTPKVSEK